MGIYDRDWYQVRGRAVRVRARSWVKILVIANVVCFVFQLILLRQFGWDAATEGLGLKPDETFGKLRVWQLVTSMFLHSPTLIFHIFFNMYFLWMFGQPVEQRLGPKSFLRFYLLAGIVASLAYVTIALIAASGKPPHLAARHLAPAIGASGAVMGVVIYFACLRPNAILYLFFFIPIRMAWAAALFVGFDLYYFVFSGGEGTGVAHTAHLGGALFGFLHFRYAHRVERWLLNRQIRSRVRAEVREEQSLTELQIEVDRLLVKISSGGISALTEEEKKFLQDASERLRGK